MLKIEKKILKIGKTEKMLKETHTEICAEKRFKNNYIKNKKVARIKKRLSFGRGESVFAALSITAAPP